ncbi:hypothetical protein LPJ55_005111 [Coemansia sp. RSA 990]|nr:hypothetical protein LPJ55_005111 [Coemansia sp. RSA 990]
MLGKVGISLQRRAISASLALAKPRSSMLGHRSTRSSCAAVRFKSSSRPPNDAHQYDMKAPELDAGFANVYQVDPNQINVTEILTTGFRLNNGQAIYGPLFIVNNTPFVLKIPPPMPSKAGIIHPLQKLDPQALRVLNVVKPKPELLVVGGGANISQLSAEAKNYLTSIGLQVELANTKNASSTFNTLAQEGRNAVQQLQESVEQVVDKDNSGHNCEGVGQDQPVVLLVVDKVIASNSICQDAHKIEGVY